MLYTYYGDARIIERHWPSLVHYLENLVAHADKGLAVCDQFQDWICGNNGTCCTGTPAGSACPAGLEMGGFNYILSLHVSATLFLLVPTNACSCPIFFVMV